jgi:hypothetical protein
MAVPTTVAGAARPNTNGAQRRPAPSAVVDDDVIDLSSPPASPTPPQQQQQPQRTHAPQQQVCIPGVVNLPETPNNGGGWRSYKVSRVSIDDRGTLKTFFAVSLEPNKPDDGSSPVLIQVRDLFLEIFPQWGEQELQKALQALNAKLYRPNK